MAHVLDSFSSPTATSSQRPHAAPSLPHRGYRITEGAEEIQMRRVACYLFGYVKQRALKGVTSEKGAR